MARPETDLLGNVKVFLKDPLSATTRSERRGLLWIAAITIAITLGHISPNSKFVFGGVEFLSDHQRLLLILLGIVNAYFTLTFFIYAVPDYWVFYYEYEPARMDPVKVRHIEASGSDFGVERPVKMMAPDEQSERALVHWLRGRIYFWVRFVVDVAIPIMMGAYACYLSLSAHPELMSYPIWQITR